MNSSPSKRGAIIKEYNQQLNASVRTPIITSRYKKFKIPSLSPEKSNNFDHLKPKAKSTRHIQDASPLSPELSSRSPSHNKRTLEDPSELLKRCSNRFRLTEDSENKKLIEIIKKLALDRPLIIKKKAHLILQDKEKYRDKIYSLNKFNEYTKIVELERFKKMRKNKSQAMIYNSMLYYLKKRGNGPKQIELGLLNVVKDYLESGNVISAETVKMIISELDDDSKTELRSLLFIIQPYIDIDEDDFNLLFDN